MYHQINPTEMFRERELALRKEAKNRSLLLGRRLRTGRTPKARSTIAAAVVGFLGALVFASLMLAASSSPAHAQTTFLVNSIADQPDKDTADGKCFALNASCTLRAAIEQANATPEADVIDFSISGGEVQTITPSSELPAITEQLTIDGYSQTGASPNTLAKGTNAKLMIELNGANAGSFAQGFDIQASNTVIKGLVINRFDFLGVEVRRDVTDVSIEGNFIGTDPAGTADRGNGAEGVRLAGTSATVGGTSPEARNLISGNDNHGVGMSALGSGNEVSGNLIGTKKDGLNPLGNVADGVFIAQSNNNLVGGLSAAAANTIAFNGTNGVTVTGRTDFPANGNRILRNSIFFNGRLGIDLNGDGVTPNDLLDFDDPGSNGLQNFPRITSAELASGQTTIEGRLNSIPGAVFTIQVFANPKGTNQGRIFLGQKRSISTDSNGNASFTIRPKKAVIVGNAITATATNELSGDTSEFSAAKTVVRQR